MGTTDSDTGIKSVRQTNVGQTDPLTLLTSNFKKTGFSFAGWSTNPNATVSGSDTIYGPMETISAPPYPNNGTNIITMYAVWVAAERDGSNNPVYLQDFTSSDCNALTSTNFNTSTGVITPGSVIALTDKRDNQIYTIAKLADNNCWMVENLRLEHSGTVGNNTNDNNVTNESLSQGYGGLTGTYGNFVGLADSENANFKNTTTPNTIYKADGSGSVFNPANNTLEDIGTTNLPGCRFPRYNNSNTLSTIDSPTYTEDYTDANSILYNGTFLEANLYSYGNYYTWSAAVANTREITNNSMAEALGTSICPSNWHLPTSYDSTKEQGILSKSYGGTGSSQSTSEGGNIISNRLRTFPNNYIYSGAMNDTYYANRGNTGFYWGRSPSDRQYAYYLNIKPAEIHLTNQSKSLGFSVRCLIGS